MLRINLSDSVVAEVLKLQAIEEGRCGNYALVDVQLNKLRYRIADLVMGSVLRDIREKQSKQPINEK